MTFRTIDMVDHHRAYRLRFLADICARWHVMTC